MTRLFVTLAAATVIALVLQVNGGQLPPIPPLPPIPTGLPAGVPNPFATPTPAPTATLPPGTLVGTNQPPGLTGRPPIPGRQAELWPGASICYDWHAGATDWCAPLGTEVHAPVDCTFLMQGEYWDDPRFGAYVMCTTDSGLEVYIGHMDMATVNPRGFRPGDRIEAGDTIGYIGPHFITTHVHVQFRRGGQLVSPDAWWQEWDNR